MMEVIINIIITGIVVFFYSCLIYTKGYEKGYRDGCLFRSETKDNLR